MTSPKDSISSRKKDTKAFVYKFFNEQKKFCPEPLIQLNMNYEKNHNIHELVKNGSLHKDCGRLLSLAKRSFRGRFTPATGNYITFAQSSHNYVVTAVSGSGKY